MSAFGGVKVLDCESREMKDDSKFLFFNAFYFYIEHLSVNRLVTG